MHRSTSGHRRGTREPDEPLSLNRSPGSELQTDTTARIDDIHALVLSLLVLVLGVGRLNTLN